MADHDAHDHTGIPGVGGSVATDAIFDAAGDLVVGTGANTAAKLAAGSEGHHLVIASGVPAWVAPSGSGIAASVLTPSSDTYIDSQNATTNNDTATEFLIGGDWADTTFGRAALITVDISSLTGKTIYDAKLRMYRTSTNANTISVGVSMQARRLLRAYVANQVTWNIYSTGNNWTTAGARSNGNDQALIRHGIIMPGSNSAEVDQWIQMPLTTLIVESLAAAETTLRFKLHFDEVDTTQNVTSWASINHGTAALRPSIVVLHS